MVSPGSFLAVPKLYMVKKLLLLVCLGGFHLNCTFAAQATKAYSIDLPHHTLHFSLPAEIARIVSPKAIDPKFDPGTPDFEKNGFRCITRLMYDFNGPFWVGANGSLHIDFIVHKRRAGFEGSILTPEGLLKYIDWWLGVEGCYSMTAKLNTAPAVKRFGNNLANIARYETPCYFETFSFPLDETMFLDLNFSTSAWDGSRDKTKKWAIKAEALREAIKATIVLAPKPTE